MIKMIIAFIFVSLCLWLGGYFLSRMSDAALNRLWRILWTSVLCSVVASVIIYAVVLLF